MNQRLPDFIGILLEESDCEVAVANTGLNAVRRAATFRPDIALFGVVMPDMNGVEAGMKLLKISPETKIVLITECVPAEN